MLRERDLSKILERVFPAAEALGLEPGHVHFELVSSDMIQMIASHNGLPVRYAHWSFGKSQQRLKTAFDYRITQIYELVVNHVPAFAFVDEAVSPSQALMIVAHVLGHADYFRHHRAFRELPSDMVSLAARHRRIMDEFRKIHGDAAVESLLDAAHVLAEFSGETLRAESIGEEPDDVLGFVARRAPRLEDWERQVLSLVWQEARYFWPQLVTKMANEGYASFFHTRILRQLDLSAQDSWETARLNAQIMQVVPPRLNPYHLGAMLYQEAYRRGGMPEVWWARDLYDDVGLVRAYLTDELMPQAGLAVYREHDADNQPRAASEEEVLSRLIADLDRAGLPRLVVDGSSDTHLTLRHLYDGRDLDFTQLPFALKQVAERIWKGSVTLLTMRQRVPHRVSHDGSDWVDQVV